MASRRDWPEDECIKILSHVANAAGPKVRHSSRTVLLISDAYPLLVARDHLRTSHSV
jgi:hypothetical protein